jgi:hypothetical protein
MMPASSVTIVVEGDLDQRLVELVLDREGIEIRKVLGLRGKDNILSNLKEYNRSARHGAPWIVLVDLDDDEDCAPPLVKKNLPRPAPNMIFRVAVRELEAWLLADRRKMADFLRVPLEKVPRQAEGATKETLLRLVRMSRSRNLKQDMLPRPGSGSKQGILYNAQLERYLDNFWRLEAAAANSDSLQRFVKAVRSLRARKDGFDVVK